jgi:hypothetical protein
MNTIRTPFINVWNPICKKYQWLRVVNTFSISDSHKMYKDDTNVYVTRMTENNQCKCKLNKFLIFTDSQVFRTTHPHNTNIKMKTFPEPELGEKNVYTNKYMGIDMVDLYKKIKEKYPRYIKFDEPKLKCLF